MYSSSNYTQNNSFNPQLQISCSMDMDFFEITKSESIKKYEENLYLLGKIFNVKNNNNNKINKEINKVNDSNSDAEDEIINLFNDKDNNDDNDDEQEEKIDNFINEMNNKYNKNNKNSNTSENTENDDIVKFIEELNISYKQLKNLENYLDKNKIHNKEDFKKFEDIIQKLKNVKSPEDQQFYNDLIHQSDNLGLINNTFKQIHSINNNIIINENNPINNMNFQLDLEPPFNKDDNLLILPL